MSFIFLEYCSFTIHVTSSKKMCFVFLEYCFFIIRSCHMNINIIIIHWSIRIKKNGKVAPKTSPHSRSIFPLQMTRAAHIHKHTTKASYKIWGYFWNSEKSVFLGSVGLKIFYLKIWKSSSLEHLFKILFFVFKYPFLFMKYKLKY